jgi:hypothetical protein
MLRLQNVIFEIFTVFSLKLLAKYQRASLNRSSCRVFLIQNDCLKFYKEDSLLLNVNTTIFLLTIFFHELQLASYSIIDVGQINSELIRRNFKTRIFC